MSDFGGIILFCGNLGRKGRGEKERSPDQGSGERKDSMRGKPLEALSILKTVFSKERHSNLKDPSFRVHVPKMQGFD